MAAATITVKLSPKEYADYKRFLNELRTAKAAKASRPMEHEARTEIESVLNEDLRTDSVEIRAQRILVRLQERKMYATPATPGERQELNRDHLSLTKLIEST